jgi:hypothetical protein
MFSSDDFIVPYITSPKDKIISFKSNANKVVSSLTVAKYNNSFVHGKTVVVVQEGNYRLTFPFSNQEEAYTALQLLQNAIDALRPEVATFYWQYIRVLATNPNAYAGIATPTISSYRLDVIYILEFTDSNSTSNTTINIDGIGTVDLLIPGDTGLVQPHVSAFVPGVTYFMTYNGQSMQVYNTLQEIPEVPETTYTNLSPVPKELGGVEKDSTFESVTIQDMFDTLLYPTLNPVFATFNIQGQSTILEIGEEIQAGPKIFTWTTNNSQGIVFDSIKIKDESGAIISIPSTGTSNDGVEEIIIPSIVKNTTGSYKWTIEGKTVKGTTINKTFEVRWLKKVFYGNSNQPNLSTQDVSTFPQNELVTTVYRLYSFNSGGFKYIAIPSDMETVNLFKDSSTNIGVVMAGPSEGFTVQVGPYYVKEVQLTNVFNIISTYRVYRTKNVLNSSIEIIAI